VFIVQAYQISQCVAPGGGIFLGKWRSSFAGNSHGKMNVQSGCALNNQRVLLPEQANSRIDAYFRFIQNYV
jgi:hypothetical protein